MATCLLALLFFDTLYPDIGRGASGSQPHSSKTPWLPDDRRRHPHETDQGRDWGQVQTIGCKSYGHCIHWPIGLHTSVKKPYILHHGLRHLYTFFALNLTLGGWEVDGCASTCHWVLNQNEEKAYLLCITGIKSQFSKLTKVNTFFHPATPNHLKVVLGTTWWSLLPGISQTGSHGCCLV